MYIVLCLLAIPVKRPTLPTAGFAGKRCERKIDLCAGSPCENGLCVDRFFVHQCICDPGWTGTAPRRGLTDAIVNSKISG